MSRSFAEEMDDFISRIPSGPIREVMVAALEGYLRGGKAGYGDNTVFRTVTNPRAPGPRTLEQSEAENAELRRRLAEAQAGNYSWP